MKRTEARLHAAAVVAALLAVLAFASSADARRGDNPGHGWGRGRNGGYPAGPMHGYAYRTRPLHYVAVRRPRFYVYRPIWREAFVVERPRYVMVRPLPCWPAYGGVSARIGVRTPGLALNLGLDSARPLYGCDFCEACFTGYTAWERHVQSGPCGPGGRVLCEPWDEQDVQYFRQEAGRAGEDQGGGYDGDPGMG